MGLGGGGHRHEYEVTRVANQEAKFARSERTADGSDVHGLEPLIFGIDVTNRDSER